MYLRCSAGSVEWMYPTGALIVNLRPNTFAPSRHLTLCIKPLPDSSGANIYLEKTGELQLLVRDGEPGPGRARCFGLERGGLFVEATPQQGIGRRSAGFQYELSGRRPGRDLHAPSAPCRPCSDTEVLLAVCTSDFGECSPSRHRGVPWGRENMPALNSRGRRLQTARGLVPPPTPSRGVHPERLQPQRRDPSVPRQGRVGVLFRVIPGRFLVCTEVTSEPRLQRAPRGCTSGLRSGPSRPP